MKYVLNRLGAGLIGIFLTLPISTRAHGDIRDEHPTNAQVVWEKISSPAAFGGIAGAAVVIGLVIFWLTKKRRS